MDFAYWRRLCDPHNSVRAKREYSPENVFLIELATSKAPLGLIWPAGKVARAQHEGQWPMVLLFRHPLISMRYESNKAGRPRAATRLKLTEMRLFFL